MAVEIWIMSSQAMKHGMRAVSCFLKLDMEKK